MKTATFRGNQVVFHDVKASLEGQSFRIDGVSAGEEMNTRPVVRSALKRLGFQFPDGVRVYCPGANPLAIALAILEVTGQIPPLGEWDLAHADLSIMGIVNPILGGLAAGLNPQVTRWFGSSQDPQIETLHTAPTLWDLARCLRGEASWVEGALKHHSVNVPDFSQVQGHAGTKQDLLVAAAGGHSILLVGPGSAKMILARATVGILPHPTQDESREINSIFSRAGMLAPQSIFTGRPLRAPHFTCQVLGLIGFRGQPGELMLSSHGVLILDEVTEFPGAILQLTLKGLKENSINTLLIGLDQGSDRSSHRDARRHLERLDTLEPQMRVTVSPEGSDTRTSADLRDLVTRCREVQMTRQGCLNSQLDLKDQAAELGMTENQCRVALTISDLGCL